MVQTSEPNPLLDSFYRSATKLPPAPSNESSAPGGSLHGWVVASVALFFVCIGGIGLMETKKQNTESSRLIGAAASAPSMQPVSEKSDALDRVLSVAAVKAHVRGSASGKAASIAVLSRGAGLVPLGESNGFTKVTLSDGRSGWIANSVIVPGRVALRLAKLPAADYVKERREQAGSDYAAFLLVPHAERYKALMSAVEYASPNLDAALAEAAESVRVPPSVGVDLDAAKWFALETQWRIDNETMGLARESARAVLYADPSNVDGFVAVALASIRSGDLTALDGLDVILAMLAPQSTNSWLVVGAAAADAGNDGLAEQSLALALRLSRNPGVTLKVMAELARTTPNAKVAKALQAAVSGTTAERSPRVASN